MPKIENSELLEKIYGRWPSFHDAEIHELKLSRIGITTGPILDLVVYVFQTTREIDDKGYFKTINNYLVTIRFEKIENLKLEDFNHQNVLWDLDIEDNNKVFKVNMETSYGCWGSFICEKIKVVEAKTYIVVFPTGSR